MFNALSAEALKMRRHKATWFLVWLYPIGFTLILLAAIVGGMAGVDKPDTQTLAEWLEDTAIIWFLPANSFGRYLLSAFVVVVFAGEYGWSTWKLIVPHRKRASLIAAKYALVVILFAIAFLLSAAITTFLSWVDDVLTGDTIPVGITASALLDLHWRAAAAAVAPTLVAIGYASLAAVLTRSTIAALVIAIVATSVEQLIYAFGPPLSIRLPGLIEVLYHALPGHHIANIAEWMKDGVTLKRPFPGGAVVQLSVGTSVAVVGAWVAALFGATFAAFGRQDIN